MKKVLLGLLLLLFSGVAAAQSVCLSNDPNKQQVAISITTATTTALVAPVAGQSVYVCGFTFTISQVVTTPNTLRFIQGTGATCGTGTVNVSGLYGDGGVTAAAPIVVIYSPVGAGIRTTAGNGLCVTTAIGATASFQGILSYIQQ